MNQNICIITGNLTKDPEARTTQSGKSVTRLRVAVNRGKNGQGVDRGTDYFDVIVWNGAGEACAKYLTKGSPVAVSGSMRSTEWLKQDGTKGYGFEISAARVEFLNRREGAPEAVEPSTERPSEDDIPF